MRLLKWLLRKWSDTTSSFICELNEPVPLFYLSSSRCPAPNGLPAPPLDKSTSNRAIALFVFPISHTERSSPYVAERALSAFLIIFARFVSYTASAIGRQGPVKGTWQLKLRWHKKELTPECKCIFHQDKRHCPDPAYLLSYV